MTTSAECLELRRRLATEPGAIEPELSRHAEACPACAREMQAARAFERRLAAAARVPVPERLAERILLRQALDRRGGRVRRAVALAAGVALAAIVGGTYLWQRPAPLAERAVAHVDAEAFVLDHLTPIDPRDVEAALGFEGWTYDGGLREARFVTVCPFGDGAVAHLVVAGERGPVTLLLIPNERVRERVVSHRGGREVVVMPMGHGSLAVVGAAGEPVETIAARHAARLRPA